MSGQSRWKVAQYLRFIHAIEISWEDSFSLVFVRSLEEVITLDGLGIKPPEELFLIFRILLDFCQRAPFNGSFELQYMVEVAEKNLNPRFYVEELLKGRSNALLIFSKIG